MYFAPNDCNGLIILFFQSAQTSAAHVLLADHDATNELVLVHSCGGWQMPALSEEHIWTCSRNPDETCDNSLESELKELSNDTNNVQIDKERQKLAIFGPCAIY
jgi:flagellar basal body rod protein FlgB